MKYAFQVSGVLLTDLCRVESVLRSIKLCIISNKHFCLSPHKTMIAMLSQVSGVPLADFYCIVSKIFLLIKSTSLADSFTSKACLALLVLLCFLNFFMLPIFLLNLLTVYQHFCAFAVHDLLYRIQVESSFQMLALTNAFIILSILSQLSSGTACPREYCPFLNKR